MRFFVFIWFAMTMLLNIACVEADQIANSSDDTFGLSTDDAGIDSETSKVSEGETDTGIVGDTDVVDITPESTDRIADLDTGTGNKSSDSESSGPGASDDTERDETDDDTGGADISGDTGTETPGDDTDSGDVDTTDDTGAVDTADDAGDDTITDTSETDPEDETDFDTDIDTGTADGVCTPTKTLGFGEANGTVVLNNGCYEIVPYNQWTRSYLVGLSNGLVSVSNPVPYVWHWTDGVNSVSGEGAFTALFAQDVFTGTLYPYPVILELTGDGKTQVEIRVFESS
ncbi:MAG: hypothetical protein JXR76_11925 [Deltaproteobacteria bacterium]|nr:hypothetical protein [Deltaproteobacteria bacterium]